TGKRPALFLESRPDDIGYNDLDDCRYRRLVLAVLSLLPSLTPFEFICSVRQAFRLGFSLFNC
ncbi:MAG: hypothetical protein Q8O55_03650, partial [Dehalococcoidales bacterium]|nr:hypothetical protein [Dehalococcoidales bacterium]